MSRPKAPRPSHRSSRRKQRTLWHPIACDCIEFTLPTGYEAVREHILHREPQRLDLLVILQESTPGEIDQLPALMSRLGKVTLIEYKGVTDELAGEDASVVSSYGAQLMIQRGLTPQDITLGVIAVRITEVFCRRVEAHGGTIHQVSAGVWEGLLNGSPLFMLETSQVWKGNQQDKLFYLLTPEYLQRPECLFPMTPEQEMLYNMIAERLIERKPEGAMALRNYEELRATWLHMFLERFKRMPMEERRAIVSTLTPEDRLEGLEPEERLQGLKAEERLKGLQAEDIARVIGPEELVRALTPEQRAELKALLG